MRELDVKEVTQTVTQLLKDACYFLPDDVLAALKSARETEESPTGRNILDGILKNAEIANQGEVPLCQDTGDAVIFLELGQDIHLVGGDLYESINEATRLAYTEGYLRNSMVRQPFSARIANEGNTPPIIHTDIVPGDKLKIFALPKGGGCENPSRLSVLLPGSGRQGIIDFVVNAVDAAGPNPCPPVILGVGIGGTIDKAVLMAKHALLRRVGESSPDSEVAELENEILRRVNNLGIGPMGCGGNTTALAVHVESYPCHIASLPVAVNFQCHSARHKEATI